MSKEYTKACKNCQKQILMSDVSGKWRALDTDGSFHTCKARAVDIAPVANDQIEELIKQVQELVKTLRAEILTRPRSAEKKE